jgi:anti-sigma regulatory factor (Ser/Thr protein kinase)
MGTQYFRVTEASQVATARRGAVVAATAASFGEVDAGRVAIAATELATNLWRHGRGGTLLVRPVEGEVAAAGIELLALDRGPGMRNVQECLRDGFSTAGTQGSGFGSVRRQADEFDVYSLPGHGTAVLAVIWARRAPPPPHKTFRVGSVVVAKSGEEACGDSWAVRLTDDALSLSAMVVDGLGHGTFAARAAAEAVKLFNRNPQSMPGAAIANIHAGLRATRGAAVAVARVDATAARLVFGGIGNVAGTLIANGQVRRLVSLNGIAGHNAARIQEFVYPYSGTEMLLVMHSDGIGTSWNLDRYPGLSARHPGLIAGVLFRDFWRARDDGLVVALKAA